MHCTTVKAVSLLALVSASACGQPNGPTVQPIEEMEFTDVQENAAAMFDANTEAFLNSDFTPKSQLPIDGDVDYSGYMGIGAPELATAEESPDVIGQMNINVDFGADDNQIQGTASNFHFTRDGSELDGSLELDASIVDTTGQLDGNISGTLTVQESATFNVNVNVTGGFIDGDEGVLAGSGVGTVYIEDIDDTDAVGIIFGVE